MIPSTAAHLHQGCKQSDTADTREGCDTGNIAHCWLPASLFTRMSNVASTGTLATACTAGCLPREVGQIGTASLTTLAACNTIVLRRYGKKRVSARAVFLVYNLGYIHIGHRVLEDMKVTIYTSVRELLIYIFIYIYTDTYGTYVEASDAMKIHMTYTNTRMIHLMIHMQIHVKIH